ncbi:MAG: LCP family protein [Hamadaea sp.]|nr:LCP family protein [Hamadaea sp.]
MGRRALKGKTKTKVRSPIWARIVVTLGILVTAGGFGGIVAAKSVMSDLTSQIEVASVDDGTTPPPKPQGKPLTGAIDLLMLGVDTRQNQGKDNARSDTIMILHVPASHDEAYLMSIPRDAWVDSPAWPKSGWSGGTGKITEMFYHGSQRGQGWRGGAGLVKKILSGITGITFDGVVVIDFQGFRNVIAALGGVHMCVEEDTWSSHYRKTAGGQQEYIRKKGYEGDYQLPDAWIHRKGCRNMAAWEALDYARQRYGLPKSDYDRHRHQQQLIRAMVKKATSAGVLSNPGKLSDLLRAAGGSLKLDTGGYSAEDFLFNLKVLAAADLVSLKTNGGTFKKSGAGEGLTQATMEMFRAAKNDTLGAFVFDNPEFLNPG